MIIKFHVVPLWVNLQWTSICFTQIGPMHFLWEACTLACPISSLQDHCRHACMDTSGDVHIGPLELCISVWLRPDKGSPHHATRFAWCKIGPALVQCLCIGTRIGPVLHWWTNPQWSYAGMFAGEDVLQLNVVLQAIHTPLIAINWCVQ